MRDPGEIMKTGIIAQARVGSTRLPGKILLELPPGSGITAFEQVMSRLKRSKSADAVITATTTKKSDDAVASLSERLGIKAFRGSESDVLSRYYECAKEHDLDIIVRISSDCPCIDPAIVDDVIATRKASKADYASNTMKRTFPRGMDVEVFTLKALEEACREARQPYEREHVTPYIYEHGSRFRCVNYDAPVGMSAPDIRVTLDTAEDYALLSEVFGRLYPANKFFGLKEIRGLFRENPDLIKINAGIVQKGLKD